MGIYREYLDKNLQQPELDSERKKYLGVLEVAFDADVLVYAARLTAVPGNLQLPLGITYEDLLPFGDLLAGLKRERVVVILETPGGSGETARDMVELLHEKFRHVTFIVPGMAKSAGTIMVLGGHEIFMGPESCLGPIDAQIMQSGGKQFSADALLEGFNRVKEEVEKTGKLNAAYIPILQQISPGEIQNAINALEFARVTVRDWLVRYKFAEWKTHSSTGLPVTDDERKARAYEISTALSRQELWHTHGRSLRIPDLETLRIKISDYSKDPALYEAIQRYFVLLRMTLEAGNAFKLFETHAEVITRRFNVMAVAQPSSLPGAAQTPASAAIQVRCNNCGNTTMFQLDFKPGIPLQPGALRFPDSGRVSCSRCGTELDLRSARAAAEQQLGQPALTPQPRT